MGDKVSIARKLFFKVSRGEAKSNPALKKKKFFYRLVPGIGEKADVSCTIHHIEVGVSVGTIKH